MSDILIITGLLNNQLIIYNLDEFIEVIKEPLIGKDKLKEFLKNYISKTNQNIISYQLNSKKTERKQDKKINKYISECLFLLQDKFEKKTQTFFMYGVSEKTLRIFPDKNPLTSS